MEKQASVLVYEWYNGGNLSEYIRNNYQTMTVETWTIIFFQVLFALAKIQEFYPTFRHNNLRATNIQINLAEPMDKSTRYYLGNKEFWVPNIYIQTKLWNFDFACIDGLVENKVNSNSTKKNNITKKENKYYDMNYFFNTLIKFSPSFVRVMFHKKLLILFIGLYRKNIAMVVQM